MKLNLNKNIPPQPKSAAQIYNEREEAAKKSYLNPVNFWTVTTEGDEEGRSIVQLGSYYGHIAEIAFHLADRVYYGLRFDPPPQNIKVEQNNTIYQAKAKQVNISFGIDSGTWNMGSLERINYIKNILNTDEVKVKESNYYACVCLELI